MQDYHIMKGYTDDFMSLWRSYKPTICKVQGHAVACVLKNQLMMQKLMINQAYDNMGLANTQMIATLFDGITRHSPEGVWFKQYAEQHGFPRGCAMARQRQAHSRGRRSEIIATTPFLARALEQKCVCADTTGRKSPGERS